MKHIHRIFSLAADLDDQATTVPVKEPTEGMSTTTGFLIPNSVTLQIDQELITFSNLRTNPPYAFTLAGSLPLLGEVRCRQFPQDGAVFPQRQMLELARRLIVWSVTPAAVRSRASRDPTAVPSIGSIISVTIAHHNAARLAASRTLTAIRESRAGREPIEHRGQAKTEQQRQPSCL